MPNEQWIVIPKWDEFQHPDALRSGTIPWVKTFTRLLSDDSYLDLSGHRRAILHGIWLEYARARGQLSLRYRLDTRSTPAQYRLDTVSLTRRLNLRVTHDDIKTLQTNGYITLSASKPASIHASTPASSNKIRQELKAAGTTTETKTSPARDPQNPPAAELNDLLNQLGITGGLRIAALQDPTRGLAVAQSVLARGARNPGGLFRTLLENGGTPAVMTPTRPRVAPCASCGVGGGRHLVDCDSLKAVA